MSNPYWFQRISRRERVVDGLLAASLVIALIAAVDRLRGAWELPGERLLLIHADDAGLCASVNRATIAALEQGAVTSASLMAPCPGFDEFAAYARLRPDLDFGLHVTLTSEWPDVRWGPVSDPASVPSLIRADGTFWKSADEFARHAAVEDVEREIRAQIDLAWQRGVLLSHLDNHMNSLFRRPDLLELFVRISRETELPIRYARTLPRGWEHALSAEMVDSYYLQLKAVYANRNPLFDTVEADNYQTPPEDRRTYLLTFLRNLEPGVTELVVHCCDRPGDDWTPPDAAGRYAETMALRSPEFAAEIDALGVRLVDWSRLRRMSLDGARAGW